jgi:hypothetical protein
MQATYGQELRRGRWHDESDLLVAVTAPESFLDYMIARLPFHREDLDRHSNSVMVSKLSSGTAGWVRIRGSGACLLPLNDRVGLPSLPVDRGACRGHRRV